MGWDGRERELPFIIKLRFGLVYKVPFPLAVPAGFLSRRFPSVVYPVILSFIQSKVVDSFREPFPGEPCGEPRGKEPRGTLRGRESREVSRRTLRLTRRSPLSSNDATRGQNFNHERFVLGAQANRYARVCLEEAIKWARQRKTFNVSHINHQVRFSFVRSLVEWILFAISFPYRRPPSLSICDVTRSSGTSSVRWRDESKAPTLGSSSWPTSTSAESRTARAWEEPLR